MHPQAGKSLSPEANEAVRELLREIVARDFDGNASLAARRFGVSQPALSRVLSGVAGAGLKLLEGLRMYTGRSLDDLVGRRSPAGDAQSVGDRVAQLLAERGMSQRTLELRAGLSSGHASRLVNGRGEHAETSTLARVAEVLGVDVGWLATGKETPGATQAGKVRLGDLPGWPDAEEEARRLFPRLPGQAFALAADTLAPRPPAVVDVQTVVAFARAWAESEGAGRGRGHGGDVG